MISNMNLQKIVFKLSCYLHKTIKTYQSDNGVPDIHWISALSVKNDGYYGSFLERGGVRSGNSEKRKIYESSFFTHSLMRLPSACPARSLLAAPMTLPISFIEDAPVCSMIALTAASSSASSSCAGR